MIIVAKRGDDPVFLVAAEGTDIKTGMGMIVDLNTGEVYSEMPIQSILARGYWNPPPVMSPSGVNRLAKLSGYA